MAPNLVQMSMIFSLQLLISTRIAVGIYPTFERNCNTACLTNLSDRHQRRLLTYPDNSSHPVRIPYPSWTSARILGDISCILLTEELNYSAILFDTTTLYDEHVVSYAAGCVDVDDNKCEQRNSERPSVHFTLESWSGGAQRANGFADTFRPLLLSVLDYDLTDQWYLWSDVLESGWSQGHLPLDYYRGYNATVFKPHLYFDHWTRIFDLLPPESIIRCSVPDPGNEYGRASAEYVRITGDGGVGCSYNDSVWFSPSCRARPDECVPLLIQYSLNFAMQIAFFLDMPLAVVVVNGGPDGAYHDYYSTVRRGRFLFGWYQVLRPSLPKFGGCLQQQATR
jgi:hypothetical protein